MAPAKSSNVPAFANNDSASPGNVAMQAALFKSILIQAHNPSLYPGLNPLNAESDESVLKCMGGYFSCKSCTEFLVILA